MPRGVFARTKRSAAWQRAVHCCGRCGTRVGADALATTLWPLSSELDEPRTRFQLGRARLCEECATATRAVIRVEARTWRSAYVQPGVASARTNAARGSRGRGIDLTPREPMPRATW